MPFCIVISTTNYIIQIRFCLFVPIPLLLLVEVVVVVVIGIFVCMYLRIIRTTNVVHISGVYLSVLRNVSRRTFFARFTSPHASKYGENIVYVRTYVYRTVRN